MTRLRLLVAGTAMAIAMVLTACDPAVTPPTIHFVGNDTCPTNGQQPYDPSPPGTNGNTQVGTAQDEMPHTHVAVGTKVTYAHDPPTSGCHYNVAQSATQQGAPLTPGVYDQEIAAEYWVHNLEHGYVAVLYNCPSGCASDFQQLRDWQKGLAPETGLTYAKVIVIPWHSMKEKFAVVSWDWYLSIGDKLDINQVQSFYANHKGQAPEPTGG